MTSPATDRRHELRERSSPSARSRPSSSKYASLARRPQRDLRGMTERRRNAPAFDDPRSGSVLPTLVVGETGVGKGSLARHPHEGVGGEPLRRHQRAWSLFPRSSAVMGRFTGALDARKARRARASAGEIGELRRCACLLRARAGGSRVQTCQKVAAVIARPTETFASCARQISPGPVLPACVRRSGYSPAVTACPTSPATPANPVRARRRSAHSIVSRPGVGSRVQWSHRRIHANATRRSADPVAFGCV